MSLKPIYNYFNSFCYYISTIQRLKSSPTLCKRLEKDVDKLTPLDKNVLWLLINYDKVEIEKEQQEFTNIIRYKLSNEMKYGNCPYKLLTQLFAPIIFRFFRDDFEKILNELNLHHKQFKNVVSGEDFVFTTNDNYNKRIHKDYCEMLNTPFNVELSRFKVGVMCIFFTDVYARHKNNKYEPSRSSGHAVTIALSTDDKFYVLDDSHMLVLFDTYLEFILDTVYEIELKDINDESINLLIDQVEDNQNLKGKFIFDKRIYRFVIKRKQDNALLGGEVESTPTSDKQEEQTKTTDNQSTPKSDKPEISTPTSDKHLSDSSDNSVPESSVTNKLVPEQKEIEKVYKQEIFKKKGLWFALVLFVVIIVLIVYLIVLERKNHEVSQSLILKRKIIQDKEETSVNTNSNINTSVNTNSNLNFNSSVSSNNNSSFDIDFSNNTNQSVHLKL